MQFSLRLWFKLVAIIAITITMWKHGDIYLIHMHGGRHKFYLHVYDKEIIDLQYLNTKYYELFRVSSCDYVLIDYSKDKWTLIK